jgi:hypothetical protein
MRRILCESFLKHLARSSLGSKFATLSAQTKLEKFFLAAIAWERRPWRRGTSSGSKSPFGGTSLCAKGVNHGQGPLVEWIEAKTCYSDCVARRVAGRSRAEEYSVLAAQDAVEQHTTDLLPNDRQASLAVAVFVLHHHDIPPGHIRRHAFNHRGTLGHDVIKSESTRYCMDEVSRASKRPASERFEIALDRSTELLCFFYSAQ